MRFNKFFLWAIVLFVLLAVACTFAATWHRSSRAKALIG